MRSSPLVAAQGGQMRPDTCTHRNNILKTANTKWEQSFGRQEQHVTRSSQSVLAQHPASEVCPTSSLTMSLSPFLTFNHISQLKQIQPPGRVGNAYCKGRKPNKLPKPKLGYQKSGDEGSDPSALQSSIRTPLSNRRRIRFDKHNSFTTPTHVWLKRSFWSSLGSRRTTRNWVEATLCDSS